MEVLYEKIKAKFFTLALASAFIAVNYSTAASADLIKPTAPNSTPTISLLSNVEFQGRSTVNWWYFWMNSGLIRFSKTSIQVNVELFKHKAQLVLC